MSLTTGSSEELEVAQLIGIGLSGIRSSFACGLTYEWGMATGLAIGIILI